MLSRILLVDISHEIENQAVALVTSTLRTLDAIHLATALSFGEDLGTLVAYDQRLLEAAKTAGLKTLSPGVLQ